MIRTPDQRRLPGAYRFVVRVLRPVLQVLTKRDWRGVANIPAEGGFVVCPNHLSHIDVLILGHFMYDAGRPVYFLGKESVFRVPVVGWIVTRAGQIPVHRGTHRVADAYRSAVAAVRAGKAVGVYPEGTLTRDPDLWPMRGKTGAARVALETRCPVVPVAVRGPEQMLAPYARWPHLFPRPVMQVRAGRPVVLDDLYDLPVTGDVLLEATARIMAAITTELEVLRGERAPTVRFDPRRAGITSTGRPRPLKEAS